MLEWSAGHSILAMQFSNRWLQVMNVVVISTVMIYMLLKQ